MNNNEYNNEEIVIDVPYYTRDICKNSKYRLPRRTSNSKNIIKYRKEINATKLLK